MVSVNLNKYLEIINKNDFLELSGRVTKVVGLTIEAAGPEVNIGELCNLQTNDASNNIKAEVVGFNSNTVLLMPLGSMNGIGPGCKVVAEGEPLMAPVGEELMGRVIDGLGRPIDDKGPLNNPSYYPVDNTPPMPMSRKRITEPLSLGIKAIDGLLTIGKGQRAGIFAGSGVGKSTLMGMIARNTNADINVIALIGERGREVREFIEKDLQEEGLRRSVVVVATSDQPALIRLKGAMLATAIAEYFRDNGRDVLLLMDSLTRFAMAQREVGLSIGEPPVSRGYTPSVFSTIPRLLERAGNSADGSITGLYTVLVDGDDLTEPITDTARSILDGHIVLSRELANRNHYPAINVLASISRVMNDVVHLEHRKTASDIKKVMAIYSESEDLIKLGAYNIGSNKQIDYAIECNDCINDFLLQETEKSFSYDNILEMLGKVLK